MLETAGKAQTGETQRRRGLGVGDSKDGWWTFPDMPPVGKGPWTLLAWKLSQRQAPDL